MSDKEINVPGTGEVVEQVTKIAAEDSDDLAVMQYLMQASSAAQLIRLRKLEESKIPTGVKPLKRTVTDSIMRLRLYPPWISFSLINDGAGVGTPVDTSKAVTVWVNSEEDPLVEGMVPGGETYNCNMDYPVIHTLYLKAASGTTAAVRIYGKEGKP